jgi:hypothetical protein
LGTGTTSFPVSPPHPGRKTSARKPKEEEKREGQVEKTKMVK